MVDFKYFAHSHESRLFLPPVPKIEPFLVKVGHTVSESYRRCGRIFHDYKGSLKVSSHSSYYLHTSNRFLLALERHHGNGTDYIAIYKKQSIENKVKGLFEPIASIPLYFSANDWLVSPDRKLYAVTGAPCKKNGPHLAIFQIDFDDDIIHIVKINTMDCDILFDEPNSKILISALSDEILVSLTSEMAKKKQKNNAFMLRHYNITNKDISSKSTCDLSKNFKLFAEITDMCLWKDESVAFVTSASRVFRFDLKTNTLSPVLYLDSLNFSEKRKTLHIKRAAWITESLREVYYICTSAMDLYEVNVVIDVNKLKKNRHWNLSKIELLDSNVTVIDFSLDTFSSRGCLLFSNGDVLCIDVLEPFSCHKVIIVNSDLMHGRPRFYVNWKTSEVVVYNDETFCSQLLPYEEFSLKHIAQMTVFSMNVEECY